MIGREIQALIRPLPGRPECAEELEETRQEACNEGTVEVKCTALYAMGERFAICLIKDDDWIDFCDIGVILCWGNIQDEFCYWPEDEDDLAIASIDVGRSGGRIERVKMIFPKAQATCTTPAQADTIHHDMQEDHILTATIYRHNGDGLWTLLQECPGRSRPQRLACRKKPAIEEWDDKPLVTFTWQLRPKVSEARVQATRDQPAEHLMEESGIETHGSSATEERRGISSVASTINEGDGHPLLTPAILSDKGVKQPSKSTERLRSDPPMEEGGKHPKTAGHGFSNESVPRVAAGQAPAASTLPPSGPTPGSAREPLVEPSGNLDLISGDQLSVLKQLALERATAEAGNAPLMQWPPQGLPFLNEAD